MRAFDYLEPGSLSEALGLLQDLGPDARPLAGGTALVPEMKTGACRPLQLVSLRRLGDVLAGVRVEEAQVIIGPMTTLNALERDAKLAEVMPSMRALLSRVANVRIRHIATIGGSLAQRDPGYDPPVLLAALDAQVRLLTAGSVRLVEIADPEVTRGAVGLDVGELLGDIVIPLPSATTAIAVAKHTPRTFVDRGVVTVACAVELGARGELTKVCIALGGVAARTVRSREAEGRLTGHVWDEESVASAAATAAAAVLPVGDGRGSVNYKRAMTEVFVRRTLAQAYREAADRRTDAKTHV